MRELKNFVERIVVTSPALEWCIDSIPKDFLMGQDKHIKADEPARPAYMPPLPEVSFDNNFSFRSYMEQCEKQLLIQALNELHTPVAVAKMLKIDTSNIYRKMQKYHLEATPNYTIHNRRK